MNEYIYTTTILPIVAFKPPVLQMAYGCNYTSDCKTFFNSCYPWWHHQMETFSALLALCEGSTVNSPHKSQWRGTFFDLRLKNGWANHRDAGDLRLYRAHYDVTVMHNSPWYALLSRVLYASFGVVFFNITCLICLYRRRNGIHLKTGWIGILKAFYMFWNNRILCWSYNLKQVIWKPMI